MNPRHSYTITIAGYLGFYAAQKTLIFCMGLIGMSSMRLPQTRISISWPGRMAIDP